MSGRNGKALQMTTFFLLRELAVKKNEIRLFGPRLAMGPYGDYPIKGPPRESALCDRAAKKKQHRPRCAVGVRVIVIVCSSSLKKKDKDR